MVVAFTRILLMGAVVVLTGGPVAPATVLAQEVEALPAVWLDAVGEGASLGRPVYAIDAAWGAALDGATGIVVHGVSTDDGTPLVLTLARRPGLSPDAKFAFSSPHGDHDLTLAPDRVVRFSGPIEGYPGSWAVMVAFDGEGLGQVQVAPGVALRPFRFRVGAGDAGAAMIFDRVPEAPSGDEFPCEVTPMEPMEVVSSPNLIDPDRLPPVTDLDGAVKGMRRVRLALQVDNLFYKFYNDETKVAGYLAACFALVSDIFERDIRVRVDLVHASIDKGSGMPPIPVPYDLVQELSGIQSGGGGSAYLPGTWSNVHGMQGVLFGIYEINGLYHQDVFTCAHEIGHNFGTGHTCDYGLDQCCAPSGLPRRGTIMSYCTQAWSGGKANADMFFHVVTQKEMLDEFNLAFWKNKALYDCNQNNIADASDISAGTSQDANANGIPDECEDCNKNGLLDPLDISSGASEDLNNNTLPDECEPDCNGNQVPDDLDIKSGLSKDAYGNGVPDECEPDCNANGVSDITEIHLDMTLDIDRNVVLDSCQDCNANGTPDLQDFQHAHNLFVASGSKGRVQEHHAGTGVFMTKTADALVPSGTDLVITPDRRVLVASGTQNRVAVLSPDLASLGDLVAPGSGGLNNPGGLLIAPAGDLLVSSTATDNVLRYNLQTGSFLGEFVAAGSGGLDAPLGMALGPNNGLFIVGSPGRVFEFDASTGVFRRIFIDTPGNGGIVNPRSLIFQPEHGRCLVVGGSINKIYGYDAASGAFVDIFNKGYTFNKMGQLHDIAIGPNGDVFIAHATPAQKPGGGGAPLNHITSPRISQFDGTTGRYRRAFVMSVDSQLTMPMGLAFMPDVGVDCNRNLRLDSCDIAMGSSLDLNKNGKPDECEAACMADCDQSGALDIDDFVCFQTLYALCGSQADCTGEGLLDIDDFICFQTRYAIGC